MGVFISVGVWVCVFIYSCMCMYMCICTCVLKRFQQRDFPAHLQPPMHMPLLHGPVKSVKGPPEVCEEEEEKEENVECRICKKFIQVTHPGVVSF